MPPLIAVLGRSSRDSSSTTSTVVVAKVVVAAVVVSTNKSKITLVQKRLQIKKQIKNKKV